MEKRLTFLMILGWLTACVPCGFGSPSSKYFRFKWLGCNTILSVLFLIAYDYVFLNIAINNSISTLSNSPLLSSHIIFIEVYWGKPLADHIIRIGSILYCQKIILLVKSILFVKSSLDVNYYYFGSSSQTEQETPWWTGTGTPTVTQENVSGSKDNQIIDSMDKEIKENHPNDLVVQNDPVDKNYTVQTKDPENEKCTTSILSPTCTSVKGPSYVTWFILSSVVISITGLVGDLIVTIEQDFPSEGKYSETRKFQLAYMPSEGSLLHTILFLVDLTTIVSVPFALIFTVVIGVSLIQLHDSFFQNLKRLTDACEQNKILKSLKCVGNDAVSRNGLINIFVEVKECFEMFSSIAGFYTLCIIFEATCSIIGGFGAMALQNKENNLLHTFTTFLTILCVARLGNFMQAKIDQNRENFEDEIAEVYQFDIKNDEVSQIIELALNWRWKLTACEVFEINHDLIPAIIATVMTVFIFMFQLKESEGETSGKQTIEYV